MRRLILEEWLSLDGFAVDRDGELDFFPESESDRFSDKDQLEFLDSVDTILLGRRTYELFVDYWPTATTDKEVIADRLNAIPKLVFSNTLSEAPWGSWPPAEVVPGNAVAEIKRLKAQEGKHMVLWGSLSLAQDLIEADLIDEYTSRSAPRRSGAAGPCSQVCRATRGSSVSACGPTTRAPCSCTTNRNETSDSPDGWPRMSWPLGCVRPRR
jgi:dihydrofolate reductase